MIAMSKERIRFYDKLRKLLILWSVTEQEADEFVLQIARANLDEKLLYDGIKYNLSRWGAPEKDLDDFISQLKASLRDDSQSLCECLKNVQASILLDDGLVINFYNW